MNYDEILLKTELLGLITLKMMGIAEKKKMAVENGGDKNNPEYDSIQEEEKELFQRINEIYILLDQNNPYKGINEISIDYGQLELRAEYAELTLCRKNEIEKAKQKAVKNGGTINNVEYDAIVKEELEIKQRIKELRFLLGLSDNYDMKSDNL